MEQSIKIKFDYNIAKESLQFYRHQDIRKIEEVQIGRHIVEFEQQGIEKADYGSALLTSLTKDLKTKYGKGFGKSNIYLCRLFYIKYQKFQTVSGKIELEPLC